MDRWRRAAPVWGAVLLAAGWLSACGPNSKFAQELNKVRAAEEIRLANSRTVQSGLSGLNDQSPIVYAAMDGDHAQLFTILPDGSGGRRLTDTPQYKCRPAWSLDHTRLAFCQYPGVRPLGNQVAILIMNADGTGQRTVVEGKPVDTLHGRLCWRPDGRVLYAVEKEFPNLLFGYDVETGRQVETVRLPKNTFMTEVHTISPNQDYLSGAGPAPGNEQLMHIGTIRRDGSREMDLMKPFYQVPYQVGTVVWSYDSKTVAFELDKVIMVMSSAFRLDFKAYPVVPMDFSAQLTSPSFSPSGRKLTCITELVREGAMGTGEQEVVSDVMIMNIDGSEPRRLTQAGTCFDPHW